MLAINIWNYFRGYVIIRVEGLTLERLLNLAAKYDIYLWDIKRHSHIVLEMKSTTKGFKELRNIVKKVGCRVEIKEKKGFPFLLLKLKERKMLTIGFLLFCIAIFLLSSTVWKIEIQGNEQTPREEIISFLKANNISIGKLKYRLDKEIIKEKLVYEYDYFSFVSVNMKGTKLTIDVKEEDLPPEKVDKSYPCHIVAKKKGIIMKVVARKGKAIVEKGEVVTPGEILITGAITKEFPAGFLLVHADGEVLALTRYSSTIRQPIIKIEEKYTGKYYIHRGIQFKDKGIKFMKGDIPYANYKESIIEKPLINLEKFDIDFPIKIISYEYKEIELKEVKQNIDFLKKANQVEATKEINKEIPKDAKIQSKDTRHQIDGNILTTQVIIEAIEDIGRKQIIVNGED